MDFLRSLILRIAKHLVYGFNKKARASMDDREFLKFREQVTIELGIYLPPTPPPEPVYVEVEKIIKDPILPGRQLAFMHISKVGGTSISDFMFEELGACRALNGLIEVQAASDEEMANAHFVCGHFGFADVARLHPNRYLFSLLREPVDRYLSHYYFAREHEGGDGNDPEYISLAKNHPLEEFVEIDRLEVKAYFENHTARFFHSRFEPYFEISDEDLLETATRNLELFDLVGIYERYADFLNLLQLQINWPLQSHIGRANVTRDRPRADEVPESVIEKIRAQNTVDIELYEIVKKRFEEDWAVYEERIRRRVDFKQR